VALGHLVCGQALRGTRCGGAYGKEGTCVGQRMRKEPVSWKEKQGEWRSRPVLVPVVALQGEYAGWTRCL
jgi:hypothetical protein